MRKTCALVIADGWGIGGNDYTNPIYVARCPGLAALADRYPLTSLDASGAAVGLTWDEAGESEVGHVTLGAGRVVYQYEPRINHAIQGGEFFRNATLRQAFAHAKENGSSVHLVGLLTKNNVHASLEHIRALLGMAKREKVPDVTLDLFTDGKDSPPGSAETLLLKVPGERVGHLIGRCYAMDRDKKWAMTKGAYDALTSPSFPVTRDAGEAMQKTLAEQGSEEFLPPLRLRKNAAIADNDAVIFFNFRADGMRQLARAFADPQFSAFPTKKFRNLFLCSFITYDRSIPFAVAFPEEPVKNTLGELLGTRGLPQLRLSETSRAASITYFFNGYHDAPFPNELRVIIPSLPIPHPEEKPELVAPQITARLVASVESGAFDFILANYPNPDTIAHTGNFAAGVAVARLMDGYLTRIAQAAEHSGSLLAITSDHANLEQMINPLSGKPETQHDPNPVPCYLIHPSLRGKKFYNAATLREETLGTLADVAPTVLDFLGIPPAPEMTGKSLLGFL